MIDTLLHALETLTFYGDEGLAKNTQLKRQLVEVVSDSQYANLKSVVLEDVGSLVSRYNPRIDLPRLALEQICNDMNVKLRVAERNTLPRGGFRFSYHGSS